MSSVGIISIYIFICFLQYPIRFYYSNLFISDISHIFLFDFNRYSISICSTSTELLSSEVYLFIYDFKRDKYQRKRLTVYLLIFTKYKRAI